VSTAGIDHARALNALVRSLKSRYLPDAPPPERTALEELVYAYLLWEAPTQKADAAYKRLMHHVVDVNELRVCRPAEIAAVVGKTYPLAEERSMRLKASLHELYLREFAVSLDKCASLSKRDARKYLDTLDGMPPFVSARVMLLRLGGHAIPVDDKLLGRLVARGVVEPDYDCARAEGVLERHVKAEDAVRVHLTLQNWSDDPDTEPRKPRPARKPEPTPTPPDPPLTVKKPTKSPAGKAARARA
jgi:endonuclease III